MTSEQATILIESLKTLNDNVAVLINYASSLLRALEWTMLFTVILVAFNVTKGR